MLFILILIATTTAIAGSAAYFSVYGLANTFAGTFWSVVIMGASLEAGKLVAASYLYRYWKKMGSWSWMLKSYMVAGIITLMFLTSAGIFGYLSSGYQADVLPLKQAAEQIRLLEDERTRSVDRKKQIDEQIAKGPIVSNVQRGDQIDPNAARTLNAATRAREAMNRQFREEQKQLMARIKELDSQLLILKQDQIKTEAKIGPITYIAKAFHYETDDATKILIFLIIFAFDPMAIALTLGVNIALKIHEEEKRPKGVQTPTFSEPVSTIDPLPQQLLEPFDWGRMLDMPVIPTVVEKLQPEPVVEERLSNPDVPSAIAEQLIPEPILEPSVGQSESFPQGGPELSADHQSSIPHLSPTDTVDISNGNLSELIGIYRELLKRPTLSGDDLVTKNAIENLLRKHGLLRYLE